MDVATERAEAKSLHKGQTYYFCSSDCKKKFDKKPEKYVSREKAASK
jgi:Cu+-exporting ATPase